MIFKKLILKLQLPIPASTIWYVGNTFVLSNIKEMSGLYITYVSLCKFEVNNSGVYLKA